MGEHVGWNAEDKGNFNDLMKVVSSLQEKDANILREIIKQYSINSPVDLLLIPTTTYLKIKNAGKTFLLNLKLSLYQNGFPYDYDTPEIIIKKINDRQIQGEANKKLRFEILKLISFSFNICQVFSDIEF